MAAPEDEDEGEEAAGVVTSVTWEVVTVLVPKPVSAVGLGVVGGGEAAPPWLALLPKSGILRSVQGVIESTTVMSLKFLSLRASPHSRIQPTFRRTNY